MASVENQMKWVRDEVETLNMVFAEHYPNCFLVIDNLTAYYCNIKWNDRHTFVVGNLEKTLNRLFGLAYDLSHLLAK